MLELLTQNCNLVAESPNKQTAIWKKPVAGANDYFIITEDACGDFLVAMLNDRDFEREVLQIDGKGIVELVIDGETTAADWAAQSLLSVQG